MGYWVDKKKEKDLMLTIFPIEGESMVLKPRPISSSDNEAIIKSRYPEKSQKLPDDVTYNEEWWKGYCQENKLDIASGKSWSSRFLYITPLF